MVRSKKRTRSLVFENPEETAHSKRAETQVLSKFGGTPSAGCLTDARSEKDGTAEAGLLDDMQVKKLEKQLRQLDWLKDQESEGVMLSPAQTAKLATRAGIEEQLMAARPKGLNVQSINSNKDMAKVQQVRCSAETWSDSAEKFLISHQIVVTGDIWLAPFETFDSAAVALGKQLVEKLRNLGYAAPTPIQATVWPLALQGHDLVAVAKTGSGKTCGFLLPLLSRLEQHGGQRKKRKRGMPMTPNALMIAPTRELAQQIAEQAKKFVVADGTRVVTLFGGTPWEDQALQCQPGDGIVVATPGRLLDFSLGESFDPLVSLKNVTYLVLDEADRMLGMGFGPDIHKIVAMCPKSSSADDVDVSRSSSSRQTLLFSATWPQELQLITESICRTGAIQLRIGQGASGDKLMADRNVTQVVTVVDGKQKLSLLKKLLERELGSGESAIVFAKTKLTCDYLVDKMWSDQEDLSSGTWCRAIHSNKSQAERDDILATFRALTAGKDNGRRGILVATDVAARGLDIPGVAMVVVFDFGGGMLGADSAIESYVHRIGRTGRAGKTGKAFTFFTHRDVGALLLVELLRRHGQKVPDLLLALAEQERSRSERSRSASGALKHFSSEDQKLAKKQRILQRRERRLTAEH